MKLVRLNVRLGLIIGVAAAFLPANANAGKIVVHPGESIQAAVDLAAPGDKVIVLPGTYQETHGGLNAVTINKPLRLIARVTRKERALGQKVVIVPDPGQTDGIKVEPNPGDPDIDGLLIRGFTVQGFPNNGIHLRYVQNFRIEKNESIDNKENGIFPTLSANGLVKRNLAYGSDDSALWVEASENVRVLRNVVHSSPTGIEVTVSKDILVKGNEAYGNAVGIGLYHPSAAALPPLPVMGNWRVQGNYVHDNNGPNNAPPGSMPESLPPGGGILVMGTDDAVVTRNRIENNDFYGIAVIDYCLAVIGTPFSCGLIPPAVEPAPDRNLFTHNKLINNGTAPDPTHLMAPFAADITYIVLEGGHGNCFEKNRYTTRQFPFAPWDGC